MAHMTKILDRMVREKWTVRLVNFGLIPLLVIAGLLLPPVSAGRRIVEAGYTAIDEQHRFVEDPDGTRLTILPEGLSGSLRIQLTSVPRRDFLEGSAGEKLLPAAEALTATGLIMKSPLYLFDLRGEAPTEARLTVPIPNDAEPYHTLDLYTWTGEEWQWLPSHVDIEDYEIEAHLSSIPPSVAVMQTEFLSMALSAELEAIPAKGEGILTEINSLGLCLGSRGNIVGEIEASSQSTSCDVVPTLRNWEADGVVRSDLVANMLTRDDWRQSHIEAIVDLVTGEHYQGIDIDYRGISPGLRDQFSLFIAELAEKLHAQETRLTVHVEQPCKVAGKWETDAYDYSALGRAADGLKIPAPSDPQAYVPGGEMEKLLSWAVDEVNRYKVQLVFSACCLEEMGDTLRPMTHEEALSPLLQIGVEKDKTWVTPGEKVSLSLASLPGFTGIQFDEQAKSYYFSYEDETGLQHIIWLEDATGMAYKLQLVSEYNLGGVTVCDFDEESDVYIWSVLRQLRESAAPRAESQFAVVWTVQDEAGERLTGTQTSLSDASYRWTAPQVPGEYTISAGISSNGGRTVGYSESVDLEVVRATPTPTPVPLPDAVVKSDILNLRDGPSTAYDKLGKLHEGDELDITGRNSDGDWLKVIAPDDTEGWVFAEYVELNISLDSVPVEEEESPSSSPAPKATPTPKPKAASAPASSSSAGFFGYGIQAHFINQDHGSIINAIKGLGFNWTKQQIRWEFREPSKGQIQWGEMDRLVESCNAAGINLLFSVVTAPEWARPAGTDLSVSGPPANPQDYADFVGALAARYKGRVKAYEIWNEQNLWYEWGNEPLDAARYVQLLKAAYQAIKAQDPNAIVVSGALTPAGSVPGKAVDDIVYLEQMYQAGLKNWCNAVGAHPSGYNVPPDADWSTWSDPTAAFRGPSDNRHHSWVFRGTMEGYRNVMVKYGDGAKRIWPTEWGWASVGGLGASPAPGYEYAADNTAQEQAEWTVKAFQMGKNWGWVGPMILWNLNFAPVAGPCDEKAAWSVVGPEWSPRPVYHALANMPK